MAKGFYKNGLVLSDGYAETMDQMVAPWLKQRGVRLTLFGEGEKQLETWRYDADAPRGTVTVLHGFTECAEKYSELIYSLLQNGYSVLIYDQRGHGASWRDPQISDPSLTHVDRFQEYVDDLRAVCDHALVNMPRPWYVFAHSMGGAVTCAFLEEQEGVFEKAALCAPMIAPQRGGMSLQMGITMCRMAKMLGQGKKRIPMSRPWSGPEEFETSCATGRERFDWFDALRVRTERYHNNGPTFSWTLEAFQVTSRLLAPGAPERIRIPVKIYTAEDDNQVLPEEQEKMCGRLPRGDRMVVRGAKHEIYRSPDQVLFPWWDDVLDFFAG